MRVRVCDTTVSLKAFHPLTDIVMCDLKDDVQKIFKVLTGKLQISSDLLLTEEIEEL